MIPLSEDQNFPLNQVATNTSRALGLLLGSFTEESSVRMPFSSGVRNVCAPSISTMAFNGFSLEKKRSTSMATTRLPHQRLGDATWTKMSKVNGELFALTYGTMVTQLIKDYEDLKTVNQQLDNMGYNIGIRLVDEFLAKSGVSNCQDFRETAEVIAKVAFKMFLGITVEVAQWNAEGNACSLLIYENPLTEFVELPPSAYGVLWYSNVLCGVLRGALEMVQMRVDARFVKDVLQGDEVTEIRLELKGMIEEAMGDEYKED